MPNERLPAGSKPGVLGLGVLAIAAALPPAYLIQRINTRLPNQPERSVTLVAALFVVFFLVPTVVYLVRRGRSAAPAQAARVLFLTLVVLLVAIDLYWIGGHIAFPADILIWSESDYVNDLLKLRLGYPLFTAQVNNDSFVYLPGSQVLTYLLASAVGKFGSVPVYRLIQVGYALLASGAAALCCRTIVRISLADRALPGGKLWAAAWLPIFFLFATNRITNPFVQDLHNDALALLLSVTAFWLLVEYAARRSSRVLAGMAVLPAVAFMVKQSLAVWAVFYCLQLALFDRPRSFRRVAGLAIVSLGLVGMAFGLGYRLWGDPFVYWGFAVLGSHGVSPLRAFQHTLDTWGYFAAGLGGGLLLLRGERSRVLLGPWLIWLAYLSLEAYTSGIAWMLNHLGPGCLIAGIWLMAAVTVHFAGTRVAVGSAPAESWLQAGAAVAVAALAFGGLGMIRIPLSSIPPDAYRYVHDIEREFQGQPAAGILLDAGTWVYQKDGVIMKDRVPSIGERGYSETGDFSGILGRIEGKAYTKILVRNYDRKDFWYEYWLWPRPSGIKQALDENYHTVGTIPAVTQQLPDRDLPYLFGEITILAPNQD